MNNKRHTLGKKIPIQLILINLIVLTGLCFTVFQNDFFLVENLRQFFKPGGNYIEPILIKGLNAHTILYACHIISALALYLILRPKRKLSTMILSALCALFIFWSIMQTTGEALFLYSRVQQYSWLSDYSSQRHFRDIYRLSEQIKEIVPARASLSLMTDIDISKDPGMFYHRTLAFLLYPIDIRQIRQEEPEYILIYKKQDARDHLQVGYEIIHQIDKNSFIAKKIKLSP